MTKQYIVQEGQNLYDVCIHLYGTVDGMSILFDLNKGLNLDALYVGQVIFYREENLAPNVQKAYGESGYIPATAGEMLDAPIPPAAPDPDAVVIQQYGLDDISITAPGTYEVSPSVIVDELGNVIQTLSPGEQYVDAVESVIIHLPSAPDVTVDAPGEYTVAPSTVSSGGSVVATLGPGENFDCPVQEVTIVYPNTDETIVEAPATFNVPASTVSKDSTVIASLSPGENFNCPVEIVTIKFPNDSQLEIEAPDTVILAAATVLSGTGSVLAELSPGESYTVGAGSGIGYQRVIPNIIASVRVGDVGWHMQNGSYDYDSDPANPIYIQELDYDTYGYGTNSGFYKLKHNNAFGNKLRFTNSIGGGALDGCANFGAAQFIGAIDGYVIDHLTGIGYQIVDQATGTWDQCIDAIYASTLHGFDNWMPMSNAHWASVINASVSANSNTTGASNLWVYNGAWILKWAGEWLPLSTTNALRHRMANGVFETVVRTTAGYKMPQCRNHY